MFMTQTEAIEPYKARLSVLNQQYHDLQRKGAALMPDGVFAHMTINIVKGLADPNMPSKCRDIALVHEEAHTCAAATVGAARFREGTAVGVGKKRKFEILEAIKLSMQPTVDLMDGLAAFSNGHLSNFCLEYGNILARGMVCLVEVVPTMGYGVFDEELGRRVWGEEAVEGVNHCKIYYEEGLSFSSLKNEDHTLTKMLFSFAKEYHVAISKRTISGLFSTWKTNRSVLMFKAWPMHLQFKQYLSPPHGPCTGYRVIEDHLRTG